MDNPGEKNECSKPVLTIGLILTVLIAPVFFGAVHNWASFGIITFLYLLLFIHPESLFRLKQIPVFFCVLFLIILALLSFQIFAVSKNSYSTEMELIKWSACGVAFLLVLNTPAKSLFPLCLAFVMTGVIVSAYGLYEVFSGDEMVLWRPKGAHEGFVTGTYFNRNHFAGFLELCLGIHLGIIFKLLYEKKLARAVLFGLLLGVSLTALIESGSRMGLVSFSLSFFFLTFFLLFVCWKTFLASLILFGVFFSMMCKIAGADILRRYEDIKLGIVGWDGGRFIAWESAKPMINDFMWFGSGLGSFEWVFPYYQSEKLLLYWSHLHNDYYELLIELGVPGFIMVIILFLGIFLMSAFRVSSAARTHIFLAWGAMISILALSLHAAADFNFAIFGNGLLYVMVMALLFKLTQQEIL